jgi:hypothetical protein
MDTFELSADLAKAKALAAEHKSPTLTIVVDRYGHEEFDVKAAMKRYVENRVDFKKIVKRLEIACHVFVDMYDVLVTLASVAREVDTLKLTMRVPKVFTTDVKNADVTSKRRKLRQLDKARPDVNLFGEALVKSFGQIKRLSIEGMLIPESFRDSVYSVKDFVTSIANMDSLLELDLVNAALTSSEIVALTQSLPGLQRLSVWSLKDMCGGLESFSDFVRSISIAVQHAKLPVAMPALLALTVATTPEYYEDEDDDESYKVVLSDIRLLLRVFPSLRHLRGPFRWVEKEDEEEYFDPDEPVEALTADSGACELMRELRKLYEKSKTGPPTADEIEAFCSEDPRARELYDSMKITGALSVKVNPDVPKPTPSPTQRCCDDMVEALFKHVKKEMDALWEEGYAPDPDQFMDAVTKAFNTFCVARGLTYRPPYDAQTSDEDDYYI